MDPVTLKKLSQPSLFQWLFRVIINWTEIGLIFFAIYYFEFRPLMLILAIILLGTRQHALALLGHEAVHRNISKNKFLNNFLGNLFTAHPLFQDINFYYRFHIDHHAYLLKLEDPEVQLRAKEKTGKYLLPQSKLRRLKTVLVDFTGIGFLDNIHALQVILPKVTLWTLIKPFITWAFYLSLLYYFDILWVGAVWIISFFTSYWAVFRYRSLTEHIGTKGTHIIKANFLERFLFLPHNTWYHYEHHLRPDIPCWNLPKVRKMLSHKPIKVESIFNHKSLGDITH